MKANTTGTERKNAAGTGAHAHGIVPDTSLKPRTYWTANVPGQVCEWCSFTYTALKYGQRFCSKGCSTKATQARRFAALGYTDRACPTCEKVWRGPPSNPSRFCSRACLRADYANRKLRECTVCLKPYEVAKAGRKGVACSPECLSEHIRRRQLGRDQSPEAKAKRSAAMKERWADPAFAQRQAEAAREAMARWHADPVNAAAFAQRSSDRMKRRHQEPEFQARRNERSRRVMKDNWRKYRDEWTAAAAERYERMAAEGTGLRSDEAEAKKVAAAKWILKQANAAMREETNYNEVYAEVQARIRAEQPFNGPEEDYFDYLKWLGHEVVTSAECREIAETYLSAAIPRFSAQWRRHKAQGIEAGTATTEGRGPKDESPVTK